MSRTRTRMTFVPVDELAVGDRIAGGQVVGLRFTRKTAFITLAPLVEGNKPYEFKHARESMIAKWRSNP